MGQEIIVFLIVIGAAIYLFRQFAGTITSKKGCGKCSGCESDSPAKAPPPQQLLQIQVKKKP